MTTFDNTNILRESTFKLYLRDNLLGRWGGNIKNIYSKLAFYGSKCARTDTVLFPISQVRLRGVTLMIYILLRVNIMIFFINNEGRLRWTKSFKGFSQEKNNFPKNTQTNKNLY